MKYVVSKLAILFPCIEISDSLPSWYTINHPTTLHTQWKFIMKPSDPQLLADVTWCCGIYPAYKVDISQHLAIPGFPRVTILLTNPVRTLHRGVFFQFLFQWIHYCHSSKPTGKETGKTHLCALVHCVVKHSRSPDFKSFSNISLPFAWITQAEPALCLCVYLFLFVSMQ